jgi:DsbC/DsbD-like thiol-disulfide interchange protein
MTLHAQGAGGPADGAKPRFAQVSTDHVRLRYKDEVTVTPAGAFSLTVEITPRAGIHVYAPGADDYQVVSLTVADQAGIAAQPLSYPPAEIYYFQPLDERIPVYQKPFTLTLHARAEGPSVRPSTSGAPVKVKGRLDYQACDDKVCFAPVSVPLTWTLKR